MGWKNKVIWHEGLFLQPQHFQQQERYLEALIQARSNVTPYPWGFFDLKIDQGQLRAGRLCLISGSGLFPDGTPFSFPDQQPAPAPLDLPRGRQDFKVCLGVPLARVNAREVDYEGQEAGFFRYCLQESRVPDVVTDVQNQIELQTGTLNLSLLTEADVSEGWSLLDVTQVSACDVNGDAQLDEHYIPPLLSCAVSARLSGFIQELLGLMHSQAIRLTERQLAGVTGASEFLDFMLLMLINRNEPLLKHLAQTSPLHPESLYRTLIGFAAELAGIVRSGQRPQAFPPYRQNDLDASFTPVMSALREGLSQVSMPTAQSIPLDRPRFGIRRAVIEDKSLHDADFVLAVKADMPTEELKRLFIRQTRIASVEAIRDLVVAGLPGIALVNLPVVPREIPFHQGFSYFQLERPHELWPQREISGGFAIHVDGEFPGLAMELWAIRRMN